MADPRTTTNIDYASLTDDYEAGAASLRSAWSAEGRAYAERLDAEFDFQRRLRQLRAALGLSQAQVGQLVGEHQTEISRLERGLVNPTFKRGGRILGTLEGAYAATSSAAAVAVAAKVVTYPALSVAKYLLSIQDDEDALTNLKLQKLLYFAQGWSLVKRGGPLFDESIKAWANGPVVGWVWHEYKSYKKSPIKRPANFDPTGLDDGARAVLNDVYRRWGALEAWTLRELTHAEGPWQDTPRNNVISVEALRPYFAELAQR